MFKAREQVETGKVVSQQYEWFPQSDISGDQKRLFLKKLVAP